MKQRSQLVLDPGREIPFRKRGPSYPHRLHRDLTRSARLHHHPQPIPNDDGFRTPDRVLKADITHTPEN